MRIPGFAFGRPFTLKGQIIFSGELHYPPNYEETRCIRALGTNGTSRRQLQWPSAPECAHMNSADELNELATCCLQSVARHEGERDRVTKEIKVAARATDGIFS